MSELNFPAVKAKSPSAALKALGIDEGAILEYNPASGMYVVEKSEDSEDVGPGDEYRYSYFAEAKGFSNKVIQALLESGVVEYIPTLENVEDEVEQLHPTGEETIVWERADLIMVCGRCGSEEQVAVAYGGVTLYMPTNSTAETVLACTECGNRMTLLYKNGGDLTEEDKANIQAQQAETRKTNVVPEDIAKQPMTPDEVYKEISDEPQEESE